MTTLEEQQLDTKIANLRRRLAEAPAAGVPAVRDPAPREEGSVLDRVDRQARAMVATDGIKLHDAYRKLFASDPTNMLGINYAREKRARVVQRRAAAKAVEIGGAR